LQQLARFQLTLRVARSFCDSWASCMRLKLSAHFSVTFIP